MLRILKACVAAAAGVLLSTASEAAVVGVSTNSTGTTVVGDTENRAALGGTAIRYFVPLGNANGTYGVSNSGNYGRFADSGNGGGVMSMWLRFTGLTIGQAGTLTIRFEDLDVTPVNDPNGFTERLNLFNSSGTSLTGLITALGATPAGGGTVSGNSTSQALTLFLGTITSTQLLLRLDFNAVFTGFGTNTAEFLRAEISQVPVPAALPLLLSGLAGLGFASRRRKA